MIATPIDLIDQSAAPNVTVTYLRANGAPIVKTYVVASTRYTIDVNGDVPELAKSVFGARIDVTNGVGIMSNVRCTGTPTASSGPAAQTPLPRGCHDSRSRTHLARVCRTVWW